MENHRRLAGKKATIFHDVAKSVWTAVCVALGHNDDLSVGFVLRLLLLSYLLMIFTILAYYNSVFTSSLTVVVKRNINSLTQLLDSGMRMILVLGHPHHRPLRPWLRTLVQGHSISNPNSKYGDEMFKSINMMESAANVDENFDGAIVTSRVLNGIIKRLGCNRFRKRLTWESSETFAPTILTVLTNKFIPHWKRRMYENA